MLNGPNLNLLGQREPDKYGHRNLETVIRDLQLVFTGQELFHFQSNVEGELIDRLQEADRSMDGVILNAGGYTHTSVSLRDAVAGISIPVVEVHLTNIAARESFRHTSLLASVCIGSIMGFGENSYYLAVQAMKNHLSEAR